MNSARVSCTEVFIRENEMNVYGDWWDKTITLFNKVVDNNGKIKWYSHIIPECFYKHTVEKITTGGTTISSDVSICRIKVNANFVPKREYDTLSEEEKQTCFTLTGGDIVVPEGIDFELNEYSAGHRSSDLMKQYKAYPGCFTIESVSINVGGGRGNEHYKVKGV